MIPLLSLAAACGQGSPDPSARSSAASPAPPDSVVVHTLSPLASPPPEPSPSPVTPAGNTVAPRKVPWTEVTASPDGRTLTVVWWSGVEPCHVLDRVEVAESRDKVTITLYEGADRRSPDAACIMLAVRKSTEVRLRAPLGGRQVADGARE
ncbi:hypothetical protein [Thermobispora bispora]|jgi:hypothetical protein|uniref:Uncharacterized protein n=1 Tax=Thermobispora bispora (strain ATCC 19993 / DSM 43833 / CBS 139.67 / JCM 10125 / KCTC 9307 / NBRC 14880 / R51) TaxID=469371 RepID=D6Y3F1_THEBD|nr:hypothetical protein [Thermobispora bispora]ADG86980.1 hypothetical protein Tbis_0248 [Thermobispora bispora DSM 43833]MBX6167895.1 hypothetical protein [Thermobispora bispora]MDI9581721.1 hypothetical protein [Thermobispora sp.]QSI46958.1 hypothetical protein CYL17_03130 [Thermobispora bispora]